MVQGLLLRGCPISSGLLILLTKHCDGLAEQVLELAGSGDDSQKSGSWDLKQHSSDFRGVVLFVAEEDVEEDFSDFLLLTLLQSFLSFQNLLDAGDLWDVSLIFDGQ